MTKSTTKTIWADPDYRDFMDCLSEDWSEANSCCGVTELSNLPEGVIEFDIEERRPSGANPYYWSGKIRSATFSEKFKLFQEWENNRKTGMIICYLLPDQRNGEVGKILRKAKYKRLPGFINPNTHNTLVTYYKIMNPMKRRKKLKKSTLSR